MIRWFSSLILYVQIHFKNRKTRNVTTCPKDLNTLRLGCRGRLVVGLIWYCFGQVTMAIQWGSWFWIRILPQALVMTLKLTILFSYIIKGYHIHLSKILCSKFETCPLLTVSILLLPELYNSLRGFLLYFRFSDKDESGSSYPIGVLLIFFIIIIIILMSPLEGCLFILFGICFI